MQSRDTPGPVIMSDARLAMKCEFTPVQTCRLLCSDGNPGTFDRCTQSMCAHDNLPFGWLSDVDPLVGRGLRRRGSLPRRAGVT